MQGKTVNGYTLQRLLGVGGMAEVWYAENEIGKPAAVKILNQNLSSNPQIVERFHNEALVMVKLSHPNIRQVYGYGYIDNRHCIIMEYLDGNDLETLLKQGRRFTEEELHRWWDQIAHALNYTHSLGIVHRDIKPSNLFLDNWGNIKLLDFGIAKIMESVSLTHTGAVMGTLLYMSPEQVKDSKYIDYHTDLYSLAVTFVHLLSGKAPYDADTSHYDIQVSIVTKPLEMDGVPTAWRNFLLPYLEKEPGKRPALQSFSDAGLHDTVLHDTKREAAIPPKSNGAIVSTNQPDNDSRIAKKEATPKTETTAEQKPSDEVTEAQNKTFFQKALPWGIAFLAFEILYAIIVYRAYAFCTDSHFNEILGVGKGVGFLYGIWLSWPYIIIFVAFFWLTKWLSKKFNALPWVVAGLSTVVYSILESFYSFNVITQLSLMGLMSLAVVFVYRPENSKPLPWITLSAMGLSFLIMGFIRIRSALLLNFFGDSVIYVGQSWVNPPFYWGFNFDSLWWIGYARLVPFTRLIANAIPILTLWIMLIVGAVKKKKRYQKINR